TRVLAALTLVIVTAACGAKVPPKVSTAPTPATPAVQTSTPTDNKPVVAALPEPAPAQRAAATPLQPATSVVAESQTGTVHEKSEPAPIDQLLDISASQETIPATPELERAVALDLETGGHDIEIPLNDRVLSYVELFTGRLKGYLEEG